MAGRDQHCTGPGQASGGQQGPECLSGAARAQGVGRGEQHGLRHRSGPERGQTYPRGLEALLTGLKPVQGSTPIGAEAKASFCTSSQVVSFWTSGQLCHPEGLRRGRKVRGPGLLNTEVRTPQKGPVYFIRGPSSPPVGPSTW